MDGGTGDQGGAKLTVVFDLDETLLFNWPHISAMDFGYVPREWDRWVEEARAPGDRVGPRSLPRRAATWALTWSSSRADRRRRALGTERNLRAIDCGDYAALVCRPNGHIGHQVRRSKPRTRKQLRRKAARSSRTSGIRKAILSGGFSERTFKLPNVFYLT